MTDRESVTVPGMARIFQCRSSDGGGTLTGPGVGPGAGGHLAATVTAWCQYYVTQANGDY